MSTVIISDDSDEGEKQLKKRTKKSTTPASVTLENIARTHSPELANLDNAARTHSPEAANLDNVARAQPEHLPPKITSRIKMRVEFDSPGIKDRGAILEDFTNYETSEHLFTSLMAQRNLKPETWKKAWELRVTIDGMKLLCRRHRSDDWVKVCTELREL